jgi:hypothetical protein
MTNKGFLLLAIAILSMSSLAADEKAIKHRFLAIDEGNCTLLHIDENDPSRNYVVPIDKVTPRDMQLIGGNRLLIGHDKGYSEIDIATGKIVKDFSGSAGVTSARRQADGSTLLAGIGPKNIFVSELDKDEKVVRTVEYPFTYVRLMRQTSKGTYLMACDAVIAEVNDKGEVVWQSNVENFNHSWKAVRMPNGDALASGGYGTFIAEIDPSGAVVRTLGKRYDLPLGTNPAFYATFQLLPNGDVVFANWQGHGKGHGKSGVQLIELDKEGKVAWQWSEAALISSLQGMLILDGLDTNVLHDERNGVMEPIR